MEALGEDNLKFRDTLHINRDQGQDILLHKGVTLQVLELDTILEVELDILLEQGLFILQVLELDILLEGELDILLEQGLVILQVLELDILPEGVLDIRQVEQVDIPKALVVLAIHLESMIRSSSLQVTSRMDQVAGQSPHSNIGLEKEQN